ncbi:MAG TPA: MFS transporter [Alphaproteobacteria bacterium]|nr:MFS transporter [Alphaproteobacteria bacterium]
MFADPRKLAVALAGLCTFLDLYATQSLLPLFARDFHASAAEVSLTVSATTFAVAIVAPFVGAVADVLGRKRIIVGAIFLLAVPTVLLSFSVTLHQLVLGRFVQGLLLPPIFAVTVAYIGDEWPRREIAAVTGIYISGSGLGGFLGRFICGLVAEAWSWRAAFLVLGAVNLLCGVIVVRYLQRERNFVRTAGILGSFRTMAHHLRDSRLLATFTVGAVVLFSFIATFTYVNFYLAAPPFNFSSAALGSIFVVYLLGVVSSALVGHGVRMMGRKRLVLCSVATWCLGLLITLVPSLVTVIGGLAIAAASGFVFQTCATSYLTSVATHGRSSAVGLYVTCYYLGGSIGGVVPAPAWEDFGWPGCVLLVVAVQILAALIVARFWQEPGLPETA